MPRVNVYLPTYQLIGYHASYFAKSSASPNPIVAENYDFHFEPASAINVLYLLYTLNRGVDLSSPLTYYWSTPDTPNPDVCPLDAVPEIPANAQTTTIGNALNLMMQQSNNVFTRAFAIRWGLGPVQAMAQSLGMSNTHLRQAYISCGFRGGVGNELTLADAAKLYSSVDRGVALTGAARSTFFNILAGGSPSAGDPFGAVVSQEAAALGKSAIVPQSLAQFNIRSKAGGYGFPMSLDGRVIKVDYSLAAQEPATNVAEAARSTIRQALLTW
jgi:Beta-lactamase enzyme family